jgi:hypothetical protein
MSVVTLCNVPSTRAWKMRTWKIEFQILGISKGLVNQNLRNQISNFRQLKLERWVVQLQVVFFKGKILTPHTWFLLFSWVFI